MPKFDVRCNEEGCGITFEKNAPYKEEVQCPECYSSNTTTLMPGVKGIHGFGKQPYDYLDGPVPEPKKIKSFAHDRRKGGK